MGNSGGTLAHSLSKRLLSYILLCSATFAMLVTAVQLYLDYSGDVSEIDKRIQQIQDSYSDSIASSLWLVDREQVYLQLNGILELPDIEYIRLSAVDDQDYIVGEEPGNGNVIEHTFDLVHNGPSEQLLGHFYLVANLNHVYARLWDKALVILLTQTVKTMLVSLFILFIFRAMVTRHLAKMASYARNLGLDSLHEGLELDRKTTSINKDDELSYVVRAINDMRVEMQDDIHKREAAESALKSSKEKFQALYDDNPSMYFTVNMEGELISVNDFGARQLGYDSSELVSRSISMVYNKGDADSIIYCIDLDCEDDSRLYRRDICLVRKDGTTIWVRETARVTTTDTGERQILVVAEDISEARQLSNQLSHQASHDALTGLVNRREFENRLRTLIERMDPEEKQDHALLYLDLDQFKIINDTCGHVAGDELLRQLSSMLKHKVRKHDTLARLGGDEFGVLVDNCSLENAENLAQNICDAVASFQFFWGVSSFRIGVSIGLVAMTDQTRDCNEVLSQADSACYAAKDLGRNRVHIYRENDAELARRFGEMQWVSRIEAALDQERFELYFQSIVPIGDTRQTGKHYEILVRMRETTGEIVSPAAFLPAAERYNLMGKIDRKVVGMTLRWLSLHPTHHKNLEACSINLSGQTLMDNDFVEFVFREFDQCNVDPSKICFEVTETAAIENLTKASTFIRALKNRGCKFSLDDFGSGLSSFAYLKNLPVDYIKIDGLFVKDIVKDPIDYAMVRSINEITQVMGKKTVAEFVEDELVLNALRNIGVDYAQGYYVGMDQPISKLASL